MLKDARYHYIFILLRLQLRSSGFHQNMGVRLHFPLGIHASDEFLRYLGTSGGPIMMGVLAFCLHSFGDFACRN